MPSMDPNIVARARLLMERTIANRISVILRIRESLPRELEKKEKGEFSEKLDGLATEGSGLEGRVSGVSDLPRYGNLLRSAREQQDGGSGQRRHPRRWVERKLTDGM